MNNLYPFEIILNALSDDRNSPEIIKIVLAKLTNEQTEEVLAIIKSGSEV